MVQALIQDRDDMVIRQCIENRLAVSAILHQIHLFQHPQLVGNGGLGHAKQRGYVIHTHFGTQQHRQDL